MMTFKATAAIAVWFCLNPSASFALNKCAEPGGGFSYSDLPCPKSGMQVPFNQRPSSGYGSSPSSNDQPIESAGATATAPSATQAPGRTRAMQAYIKASQIERRKRDLRHEIDMRTRQIESLLRNQDTEIQTLRRRASAASNNLAGATWEGALSTQMTAVTGKYQNLIKVEQDAADTARKQLAELK